MVTSYDQGMDIYVVSNVWDREGATVIGAADDLDTAQQIADRLDGRPEACDRWAAWITCADTGMPAVLERSALLPDGATHPSLSQEIVCVPLAGTRQQRKHALDPWPDKVSFDWQGNPVVQLCLAVVDGQVCRRPYSDPVHLPMPSGESGKLATEGPWKGWRAVGSTEGSAAVPELMKPEIGGEVRNDPLGIFTTERG
jgi:hypothetical protein